MQTIRNGLGDGRPRSPRDSSHLAEAKAAWAELLDPADAGRHLGSTDGRAICVQSLGEALVSNPDVAFQVGFLAGTRYVTLVQDGLGRGDAARLAIAGALSRLLSHDEALLELVRRHPAAGESATMTPVAV